MGDACRGIWYAFSPGIHSRRAGQVGSASLCANAGFELRDTRLRGPTCRRLPLGPKLGRPVPDGCGDGMTVSRWCSGPKRQQRQQRQQRQREGTRCTGTSGHAMDPGPGVRRRSAHQSDARGITPPHTDAAPLRASARRRRACVSGSSRGTRREPDSIAGVALWPGRRGQYLPEFGPWIMHSWTSESSTSCNSAART